MSGATSGMGVDLSACLEMAGRCDTGVRRDHNEDAMRLEPAHGLAILADGMGGHNAGEVASGMAVDSMFEAICNDLGNIADATDQDPEGLYSQETVLLRRAIEQSNRIITQAARSQQKYDGMGTTIVAALFHDDAVSIGSVGDSRLYRLRRGALDQMTRDHTLLQELVDRGFYTREEARASLNRNIVTRALGAEDDVEVDLVEDIVLVGDRYLLCSDGLNDMLDDEEIRELLAQETHDLDTIPASLIERANNQGGEDNVTAVVIEVRKPFPSRKSWFRRVVDWFQ